MKTWTNPTVEELEVKMTAWLGLTNESERPNGVWDGNMIVGGGSGGSNEGGSNEDGSLDGSFGTES